MEIIGDRSAVTHMETAQISVRADRECLPDEIQCLPPLPQALDRLFEILRDESACLADLEEIIRCDPALAGKILQMANSAYYGMRGKVCTLSRAVMTMGFHEVRSICLYSLIGRHFSGANDSHRSERAKLWKHSLAVAKIAREIVERRPWGNKEEVYTLGLLHDMGRLAMLVYYHDDYEKLQPVDDPRLPLWEDELRAGFDHGRVGRWIAIRWGLPDVCRRVLELHHLPPGVATDEPMVMVIHLADLLSQYGQRPELAMRASADECCRALCIPEEEWQKHLLRSDSLWKEVEQLWAWLG